MDVRGYKITETLFRDRGKALYRATRDSDHLPVVLKMLDPRASRPRDVERLRREYETGAKLALQAIVRSIGFEMHQGAPVLVLEDCGGRPLDALIAGPMDTETFLGLARSITRAVADLHEHGVIHKDLKPENILVDPRTTEVRLADMGLATQVPREQQAARPPELIEGSLPYMSPEQTGRMNRALDSRSDLYSLGVTFYQMLTGRLPFEGNDPLEWVHCHIAREPASPSKVVPGVPEAVSRIVLKLLAKMPDDRYQTANGLERDLARCLGAWRRDGRVDWFPLGQHDVQDRLRIPQKLYGREEQVGALLAAFERVVGTGAPELVLVSGYSGIGKSSLVHELQKPIVRRQGLFAAGKFDQYKRDVPYSTIVQAFRELVLGILVEGEERVARWRERLRAALGSNGRLIVDVIPQLELLVGRQPPVPGLPPAEAQRRFRMVLRHFIAAFTSEEGPLTLFVDDLQWADPASLALLQDLVTHPDVRSLLVVGAYRDNEVAPSHPLASAVESARRGGGNVSDILVGPLSDEHLTAFLADALHCHPREAEPLAALVREKTGSNPFFVIQFLTVLYREGLVAFDRGVDRWRWDVERIRAQGYTDNIVELMLGKLRHLPLETQEALERAACIGASVDVDTLAAICPRDPEGALRAALEEDLLIRFEGTYRFPHDRVQEAAYSLIPEGERPAVHLGIGRRLLARTAPGQGDDEIFEIVNQLNRAAALITSPEERERVAELNLVAGRRAKGSAAYASALNYLAAGSTLLGEDVRARRYDLAFPLEFHRAECEYLAGELEAAEERLATLSRQARSLEDIAAVTSAQCDLYTTRGHGDRAVEVFLEYMRRIGVDWSPHPTRDDVRREVERVWRQVGSRPIGTLVDLPEMADPAARATVDLMTWAHPPAQFFDENLGALVIARMVNLSLEHGNSDASGLAYAWLGSLLGSLFGDYPGGYRFGEVGLELVEKRGLLRFQSRVYVIFGALVSPHSRHLREGIPPIRRAYDTALEACDISYACYARNAFTTLLLAAGHPLDEVQHETENALDFVKRAKFGMMIDIIESKLRLVRMLRGEAPERCSFDDAQFGEARFERLLRTDRSLAIAVCWYFVRKLQERYYSGDYRSAIVAAAKAEALLWTSPSFVEEADYHLYAALARAAFCDGAPDLSGDHQGSLAAHAERLAIWARSCPENFQSRSALVSAERARLDGRELEAERLYEEAIRSARENGFVHIEALAYELASGFYRARGFELFADAYLREARACYLRWGADGKARQLERLHPQIIERAQPAPSATFAVRAEQLDLLSAVKASQTISGEIVIEKLVATLLRVVLEQGGARRGCLVLERDGALHVEAEASIEQKGLATRLLPSLPVESSSLLPLSVVHYARVTRQPVIVEDVSAKAGKFARDAYFSRHRTRSVLCLPILRRAELVGLLYLENGYVAGAFTSDRLTTLSLLASQAAISVENARFLLEERQARQRAAFLAEAGALLSETSLDYEETLKRLSRLCVQSLADWCVLDLVEGREIRRVAGACADPAKEPLLEVLRQRYPARWDSPHPAARCLRSGDAMLLPEITDDLHRGFAEDEDHIELVLGLGTRSGVVVPLVARGQTIGVFTVASATPARYGQADLELAQELARRAASAIDNARLYREIQRADRRKSEFIAVLSHELRNPLAPIRTGLQLLRRSLPDTPIASRAWEIMARQTDHLTRLVDDLLDITRISRGKIELKRARSDLRDVVRATCEDLRPTFERAEVVLDLLLPPVPLWVEADATRVAQVIGNLLQNAAKFTPTGGSVRVEVAPTEGCAAIAVRDTGVGMEPAEVERMFEPFAQAEQDLARTQGGLGLGLALAKGLIELHGGSIRARSEGPGRGSEFVVTLPLAGPR